MKAPVSMKANHHQGHQEALAKPERHSATSDQVPFSAFEDPAAAFCCWLLHFIDLESAVVIEARSVSHAAVLGRYLDAVAAEPLIGVDGWPVVDKLNRAEMFSCNPKLDTALQDLRHKTSRKSPHTRNTHTRARPKEKHRMDEIKNVPRSVRRVINKAAHVVGLRAAAAERARLFAEIERQRKDDAQMPLLDLHRFIGQLVGVDEPLLEKERDHE